MKKKRILTFEEFFTKFNNINENYDKISDINQEYQDIDISVEDDEVIDYYNMVDEKTGVRYNIPFLSTDDDNYVEKYKEFMKLKLKDEDQFNELMEWR